MDSEDEYQPDDSDYDAGVTGGLEALPAETKPRGARGLRKRRRESREPPVRTPLKRGRGAFNAQYLGLLNEDVQDAAAGIIHEDGALLEYTQIGAVGWSTTEKEAFFSALGRLGRDDLAGIASRIRTKSEPEVRQYMILLEDFDRARREDEDKRHRTLQLVDIPAAAEVGQECCIALERAADSLALRQERHEEALERKRWHNRWLITPSLARVLENQYRRGQDLGLPFAELFAIRNWLHLSDRVFMNSAVPDGNWRSIEKDEDEEREGEPSMRATAFADFHALAVSVTRRLVLASLYVANSRVRTKNAGDPRHRARPLIRVHDVRAAVSSVGMNAGSRWFWAQSARRLRLDVHDGPARGGSGVAKDKRSDEEDDYTDGHTSDGSEIREDESEGEGEQESAEINIESSSDQDDDYEIMTYDAVETALGVPPPASPPNMLSHDTADLSDAMSISSTSPSSPSARETEDETEDTKPTRSRPDDPLIDAAAVERDLGEAIHHGAVPYAGTSRARHALRARIRAEHLLEAEAERLDARAGAREEARLWAMLRGEEEKGEDKEVEQEEEEEEEKERAHHHAAAATDIADGKDKYGDGDADEEEEGGELDDEDERPRKKRRAAPRLVGLDDLGPNWRDGLRYYSEWESVGGAIGHGLID